MIGLAALQTPDVARLDSLQDTSNGWAGLLTGTGCGWTPCRILAMAAPDYLQVPAVARLDSLQDTSNGWAGLLTGTGCGWTPDGF